MKQQIDFSEALEVGIIGGTPIEVRIPLDDLKGKEIRQLANIGAKFFAETADPEDKPEPKAPEPEKKPAKKPEKKVTIDYGKIKSLHNAGWKNKEIADEMHMTPVQISNALTALRRKGEIE